MPDINHFIQLIKYGKVVAFPTETVYGLGADAWNPTAIKKIFKLKGRPSDNPLIVHISTRDSVSDFADNIPEIAYQLMDAFWPGPLTLVLQKKPKVLDVITAGLNTVAIRMPNHPLALELISGTGPLVAPSANLSGRPSPTKAKHVRADFGDDFPVIKGGTAEIGLESTVLDLTSDMPVILRPGKIGKTEIEEVISSEVIVSKENAINPKSPGQKYSHYKPEAEVIYSSISSLQDNVLYLVQKDKYASSANVILYSGDLDFLSKELYDRFRQADIEEYAAVVIEEIDESLQKKYPSIYSALMNRIKKAAG